MRCGSSSSPSWALTTGYLVSCSQRINKVAGVLRLQILDQVLWSWVFSVRFSLPPASWDSLGLVVVNTYAYGVVGFQHANYLETRKFFMHPPLSCFTSPSFSFQRSSLDKVSGDSLNENLNANSESVRLPVLVMFFIDTFQSAR